MCTGIFDILPAILGAAGAAVPLLQKTPKPPAPPPLINPAMTPESARAPGAIVRVGAQGDSTEDTPTYQERELLPTRQRGTPVQGLGRSGLAL